MLIKLINLITSFTFIFCSLAVGYKHSKEVFAILTITLICHIVVNILDKMS